MYPTIHLSPNHSRSFYRGKHIRLAFWWWRAVKLELFFVIQTSPLESVNVLNACKRTATEQGKQGRTLNIDSSVSCSVKRTFKMRTQMKLCGAGSQIYILYQYHNICVCITNKAKMSNMNVWLQIIFDCEVDMLRASDRLQDVWPDLQTKVEELQGDLLSWTTGMSMRTLMENKDWTGVVQVSHS